MDKPSIVAIPATIEDAVGTLNGIDALLTATEWERAAIVAAFVIPNSRKSHEGRETTSQFAARGIAGLRTTDTVALYANRWLDANDGVHPKPGESVALPGCPCGGTKVNKDGEPHPVGAHLLDWPPNPDSNFGSRVSPEKAEATVAGWSPEAKAAAVSALIGDTEMTGVVVEELVNHPDIVEKAEKQIPGLPAVPKQPRIPGAESVVTEIGSLFGAAYDRIDDAADLLEDAIQNGVRFDSELEYPALIGQPEFLNEVIGRYLKTVAMVQTEEGAIK